MRMVYAFSFIVFLLPMFTTSFLFTTYKTTRNIQRLGISTHSVDLGNAIDHLEAYNTEFIARMQDGRKKSLSPAKIEFRRAQELGPAKLQAERIDLRNSAVIVAKHSNEVILGIMAENYDRAIITLQDWVPKLGLKKGILRTVDDNNEVVDISSFSSTQSVYVKFNSTDGGDAYMKSYDGLNRGVIFQPILEDGEFRQYGDLPLSLFQI